ncbi:MAG: hypothetical protein AAF351_07345 [Pseudomonadota bacterium]
MWLPEPLYKSLPTTYLVVGLLILSGALYMGSSAKYFMLFAVTGAVSLVAAVVVFLLRRSKNSNVETSESGDSA